MSRAAFVAERERLRTRGCTIAFTNGCFDLLHRAHLEYLRDARRLADFLFVGLNDDRGVRALKGPGRPLMGVADRVALLAEMECVDRLCVFPETSVESLVKAVRPDVLVKGGDYQLHEVVGRACVEEAGGRVCVVRLWPGCSTSELINRIRRLPS